jgi:hypothetical protein
VAAAAIVWAAQHAPRELNVGGNTSLVLWLNKFVPGFGDWYLGKTGYDAQQQPEPADPHQPDNLWQPLPGDAGAHGAFDSRAQSRSFQLWATTRGRPLTVAAGLGALLAAGLARHKHQRAILDAVGAAVTWTADDTAHLLGACRMGAYPRSSVVDPWGRCWEVPNLFICDGSVFVTSAGVNPSLTIQALAAHTAAYIADRAHSGAFRTRPHAR